MKKLKKSKLFFWVQDLWPETLIAVEAVQSQRVIKWIDRVVKFIYRHCDKILVQSQGFIDKVMAKGVPEDKIAYFPNSAEEIFQDTVDDKQLIDETFPPGFNIVFAGNIGTAQSFSTLIAAAKALSNYTDIHWIILGDGHHFSWLQQQVISHKLAHTIHLWGRKPLSAMPDYFAKADVLFATLRKDPIFSLTIPSKVQSYLASGKPILACLAGESHKVIHDAQAGICVPPEDSQRLCEAVIALYQMTECQRQTLGENGKRYFQQHFSRELLNNKLDAWLQQAVMEEQGV